MKLLRDRQTRYYLLFHLCSLLLCAMLFMSLSYRQNRILKEAFLARDGAILTSLLEQGVPDSVAARAITASGATTATSAASSPAAPWPAMSSSISPEAAALMTKIGLTPQTSSRYLTTMSIPLQALNLSLFLLLVLMAVLFTGSAVFFLVRRERLYRQAIEAVDRFTGGDFSVHLPRSEEGTLHLLFSSVDHLAMALRSQGETEHRTKEFLKETIDHISHQLKTPLAAMTMYSEIISGEPDNPETVASFSSKMRQSLSRMEQLIGSLLKITRLDAGNINFEPRPHPVRTVIERAIQDLSVRAGLERKELLFDGGDDLLFCDISWTAEAIGNLVKNALDHTGPGGRIRISWESTPAMARIQITDNGSGIPPEDIHHIFKRFYRSRHSLDTQGAGLGLPLAKSIVEGQGGLITVQSDGKTGATFTLSFLTKP